jgi:hypothetical protein
MSIVAYIYFVMSDVLSGVTMEATMFPIFRMEDNRIL